MSAAREFVVGDLLEPRRYSVRSGNTVAGFLAEIARERGHSTAALPVMRGEEIAGVISLGLAAEVPPGRRSSTSVDDVMLGAANAHTFSPRTPLVEADERLRRGPAAGVVVEDGRVLGVVTRSLVSQALQAARSGAARGGG